jgi:hypothetical protein
MGPDADRGESTASVSGSVHHEEHGLVLPDQEGEPVVTWDVDLQGLVVGEFFR